MPQTHFDSELTGEQIEAALNAIHGVVSSSNNGKVLCIEDGKIAAKSASTWTGGYPEPTGTIQITENGIVNVKDYATADVNVQGGGGSAVVQPLSVTQNGTYNPPSGVDGYAPVTVNVSGGGGGGPIYYGTSVPGSSIGSDEDIYIQYEIMNSSFDHTYKIAAQFRKVNGVWEQYTNPTLPTKGVHIWTNSTGGSNAAMYVQNGYWDTDSNTFVATDEVESVIYTSVRDWAYAKDCNNVALLAYPSNWQIKASTTVTDGTNIYQADQIVAQWAYNISADIYVYKPQS